MPQPFEEIRNFKFKKLVDGSAANIEDFYGKIISEQFENQITIKKIHKTLISYINNDSPTFFIRLYGSFKREKYNLQRRGFLTQYPDKTKTVFCDNTFTLIFTGMKLAGISFCADDLTNFLNQKKLIVGFAQVSNEKKLAYYTPKGAIKFDLNSLGWYQAHIYPVGYGFYDRSIKYFFPNPKTEEYDPNLKKRIVDRDLTEIETEILKAHFLRLIHPFNSFFIPKVKHLSYEGKNLGEEEELILFVRNKVKEMFSSEYDEFEKHAKLGYNFNDVGSNIKKISWHDNTIKLEANRNFKNQKQLINSERKNNQTNIGKYVRETFILLNGSRKLKQKEIENLQDLFYCKDTFNIPFPVLIKKNLPVKDIKGHNRYYTKDIVDGYWLCSQWHERHWDKFLKWEKDINKG